MPFQLPSLPYEHAALEPFIDAHTMELHHGKHHAGYVNKLNAALAKHPELEGRSIEELLRGLKELPREIRTAVRNNGGGHANHSLFWQIMVPNGGGPADGRIAPALKEAFGGFDQFKREMIEAGAGRFGSGWVWLVQSKNSKLRVLTTPNQDSPLMDGHTPILGIDLWEHAYYLKYENRRAEYLEAWWNLANWKEINRRFELSLVQADRVAA